ncbi:glucokinase [Sandaracinus amylolyticus]|uniref:glucokinase n=1 Tax=Sandaracinus amylolyticus TaxID=927083 RepID=UPI001F01B0A8|nr:glucokinase [Sandaracinus amylolyticus]UJR79774.1 Glucokinase [Sandaracinus amylolyticus]
MVTIGTRVLAGDVGGTKTALSLCERHERGWVEVATTTFPSADHAGLEAPARAFLQTVGGPPIVAAAFGVAGPVKDNRCHTTNLPWLIEPTSLSAALGARRVAVINDFEATARGLLELGPEHVVVIQEGQVDPHGPIAVLGAGTGLGEATVVRTPAGVRVLPSEGGHTDFAPRDEVEDGLLRFLRRRHPDHVSYERVVSGMGLEAIHAYLVESGLETSHPSTLARMREEDAPAVIGELGARGLDPACTRAVAMFVSLYGAEAGNLALKTLPTGGLFVAGGIAPKQLDALRSGAFRESFLAKGRMRPVLETIRVSIVIEPRTGLHGARALAASLAE